MREKSKRNMNFIKAVGVITVALVFVMPGSTAVVNFGIPASDQHNLFGGFFTTLVDGISDEIELDNRSLKGESLLTDNIMDVDADTIVTPRWEFVADEYIMTYSPIDDYDQWTCAAVAGNVDDDHIGILPVLDDVISVNSGLSEKSRAIEGIIYVDDDNTAGPWDGTLEHPYQYIQDGVNAAQGGDTVFVFNGTYYEHVVVYTSINLVGESSDNVIIDGSGSGTVVYIIVSNVNVTSLTMRNGAHGIYLYSSNDNTIMDCNIHNNIGSYDYNLSQSVPGCGIDLYFSGGNTISNCTIYNNSGYYDYNTHQPVLGVGIFVRSSSGNSIRDCTVYNNSRFYYNGSDPYVTVAGFYLNRGMDFWYSSDNSIQGCNVYNNGRGIYVRTSENHMFTNNTMVNNGLTIKGDTLERWTHTIDSTNTVNGKPIYYYKDQAGGIVPAGAGQVILVNCTDMVVDNQSCSGGGTGISLAFSLSILVNNSDSYDNSGSGIYLYYSNSSTIANCTVYNNTGDGFDFPAGIRLDKCEDSIVINCTVYGHSIQCIIPWYSAQGINIYKCINCAVMDCEIYENWVGFYIEGVITAWEKRIKLRNNSIYNNTINFEPYAGSEDNVPDLYYHDIDTSNTINGKAFYYLVLETDEVIDGEVTDVGLVILVDCSNITVRNVSISDNHKGLLLLYTEEVLVIDCTFSNNFDGVHIWYDSGRNQIINCGIFNNERGIAVQGRGRFNKIINCDVYNNSKFAYWSQGSWNNSIIGCDIHDNGFSYNEDFGGPPYPYPLTLQFGGPGIIFHYVTSGNIVENCTIYNNYVGICVYRGYCEDQTLRNNVIFNNTERGLFIQSKNCLVENCSVYDNVYGISIDIGSDYVGTRMANSNMWNNTYNFGLDANGAIDVGSSNMIGGKPMVSFIGENDLTFNETNDFGWLGLFSCTNILVEDLEMEGLLLVDTTGSMISNVSVHNNGVTGICLISSPNNNMVNCKGYDNARDGICLASSSWCTIAGFEGYRNKRDGIHVSSSVDTDIVDCEAYGHYPTPEGTYGPKVTEAHGIYTTGYRNSNILDCEALDNQFGIALWHSSINNTVENCKTYNNSYSIFIYYSKNNVIRSCAVNDSEYGIHLCGSHNYTENNQIYSNNVYNNGYGIYIRSDLHYESNHNLIYHNNMVGNTYNAFDGSVNQWDNENEGNYWDDYTGTDANSDGIGDTPYNISGGDNQDRYPLMEPIFSMTLLSPANGSFTQDQTPTFDWADIAPIYPLYPVNYTLQVATDPGFSAEVINQTGLEESEYTPVENMTYDTYYWRVKATVGIYSGDWSDTWSFTIELDETPPTTPYLISPEDNSTVATDDVFFDWTDAYDNFGIDYYTLQVATDENFDDIVSNVTSIESERILVLVTVGIYYWRVRAVDNNGWIGNWSEVWMFIRKVDIEPPVVEILFPVGGEYLRGTVTITWDATDDLTPDSALLITIEYRCGGPWKILAANEENDGSYDWNTIGYPDSAVYKIRVSAEDNQGNTGSDESSTPIYVDNTNPSIKLTKEKIGIRKYNFIADVSDETSGIDRVEFYLDDELQETVTIPPYEWIWQGFGNHSVKAIVYDKAGNSNTASMSTPHTDRVKSTVVQSQFQSSFVSNDIPKLCGGINSASLSSMI